jgi:hypothetical protein
MRKVWITRPEVKPNDVNIAAFFPWTILLEITYKISGPGDKVRVNEATVKVNKVSISIK